MKMDDFKQLTPFEQEVLSLLMRIARDIESIRKLGED